MADRYRHYKGGEYDLLAVARHTETDEALAIYRACYGERRVWVRPLAMFSGTVEWEGTTVPRFAPIPTVESEILPCPNPECGGARMETLEWEDFERSTVHGRDLICSNCGYQVVSGGYGDDDEKALATHNSIAGAAARAKAAEARVAELTTALEAMVDTADAFRTPDDPNGWAAYTVAREALGVPVSVGKDAFSGREFYESYRCALRSKAALAASAPGEKADHGR